MSNVGSRTPLIGIFVGGRGSRLGGVDKGNLTLDGGETLVARLVRTCAAALPGARITLVGAATAYAELGLVALLDEPAGIGPLGGLHALLLAAERGGESAALVLACDLPFVSPALVRRLAFAAPSADFVAPREGEIWHTLVARYGVGALASVTAAIRDGERALQRVVRRLGEGAVELSVSEAERAELRDLDTPEDLQKNGRFEISRR